ncbi:ABC transporter ATP-binding protein [Desertivirga arenae]|uniref:ABC transporter ATP-binding protein n=1 Tax=Desertivirga arenae TaxID=2810309 RepID=UPI001A9612F3|nr:ABC transporter ATP-binding protein [Pedobacter sp. SYSU D00823]
MGDLIELRDLKKSFGKLEVLKGINCGFEKGKVVSVLGPNAAGKTTLIKSVLGMVIPDQGNILYKGELVTGTFEYKKHIGYMPQIGRYPDNMKIGQLFEMMQDLRKLKSDLDTDLVESYHLKSMYNKTMSTLSGGTRQKVSAALAFMFQPEVLILDEPTAGLDPIAAEILKDKIMEQKNKGKLILITSHILTEADELADIVMYLLDGNIRFYKPIDVLKSETGETRLGKALTKILAA